jgi:uncharacterized membrane protein
MNPAKKNCLSLPKPYRRQAIFFFAGLILGRVPSTLLRRRQQGANKDLKIKALK